MRRKVVFISLEEFALETNETETEVKRILAKRQQREVEKAKENIVNEDQYGGASAQVRTPTVNTHRNYESKSDSRISRTNSNKRTGELWNQMIERLKE